MCNGYDFCMLQVKHYTDYKSFLSSYVEVKRKASKSWTLGVWTQQLDLKSTSSISKVLSGQRLPGKDITNKLVQHFKFSKSDEDYFRGLIRLHKVKDDPQLAVAVLEKLGKEHPTGSVTILDDSGFQVISNWYSLAVREVVRMGISFKNLKLVTKFFNFGVSVNELSTCLKSLKGAGLLKENQDGEFLVTSDRLHTQNDYSNEAVKKYHEKTLGIAQKAIREIPIEMREFQGTTLNIDQKNFLAAQEMLRDFREKFVKTFEETSGDQIYQLQLQFFPLTKKIKKEKYENI